MEETLNKVSEEILMQISKNPYRVRKSKKFTTKAKRNYQLN